MQELINLVNGARESVNIYRNYRRLEKLEEFFKLPVLRKEDLRSAPIRDRVRAGEVHGHVFRSGATSGPPSVTISENKEYASEMNLFAKYVRGVGLGAEDVVANFFPSGPLYSTFVTSFDVCQMLCCTHLPFTSGAANLEQYSDIISTFPPTVLLGLPGELLKRSKEALWEAKKVRLICYSGEDMNRYIRDELSQTFPLAKISPFAYGTTECGNIGFPSYEGFKTIRERIFAEVVNRNRGGVGRLVITCLDRVSMPIIRYDTEDIVKVISESEAGVTEFRVIGRESNIVKLVGHSVDLHVLGKIIAKSTAFTVAQFVINAEPTAERLGIRFFGSYKDTPRQVPKEALSSELREALHDGRLIIQIDKESLVINKRTGKVPFVIDHRFASTK